MSKPSEFVKQSVKHMSVFNRKKQFETVGMISLVKRPAEEIEKYERHTKRTIRKIFKAGEKRRERS